MQVRNKFEFVVGVYVPVLVAVRGIRAQEQKARRLRDYVRHRFGSCRMRCLYV
jgi:hypothetical protein